MTAEVPPGFTYLEDDEAAVVKPAESGFKMRLPCCSKPLTPEEEEKKKAEEIKKKEEEEKAKRGSLIRLYWSLPAARWRLVVGVLCSIVHGVMLPGFSALFGELFNTFFKTPQQIREDILVISMVFLLLGFASFIACYFKVSLLTVAGELLTRKVRHDFFAYILSQDAAWMDATSSGAIASRISGDMTVIQAGVGERIGQFVYYYAQFATGLVVAFIYGWKMTLVLLSLTPALMVSGALQAMFIQQGSGKTQTLFSRASTLLEETISGYRTVLAFVLGDVFKERFNAQLKKIDKISVSLSHWTGLGIGVSFFIIFAIYSLGFWYAGTLVARGEMKAGDALAVFFAVVMGAMGLGQASQISPDFDKARGALATIGEIMGKKPGMDLNIGGRKLENMQGNVTFTNVAFTYPTRPDRPVFTDLNLEIKAGKTTAIVGSSGGGKSTVVQLIERFYDVASGSVVVDGVNIKELDTEWLRTQMALVSQEPVLFSCSIGDNIRYGKHDATDEEVIAAAKLANAHKFIDTFPDKYDTLVGERGTQLSGGQKQRVAIARAVLRNPKLLLLDEATSALDAESEVLVQEALNRLMQNRTSVVVAHRLSTIRRADTILVLGRGKVEEQGTHDALLARRGAYYDLVLRQLDEHGGKLDEEDAAAAAAAAAAAEGAKAKQRDPRDLKPAAAGGGESGAEAGRKDKEPVERKKEKKPKKAL